MFVSFVVWLVEMLGVVGGNDDDELCRVELLLSLFSFLFGVES